QRGTRADGDTQLAARRWQTLAAASPLRLRATETREKEILMQEYMSLALPLMAVAGLGVAFALGLTIYRNGRHKEKVNRTD
ncbi:hypothetical protein, partial [Mycobacteroides abscessus]|uniref:hypothetical protein n=1 Tax=Mycobacteroides abscessus TaxID=36809 RepID=UPI001A994A5E